MAKKLLLVLASVLLVGLLASACSPPPASDPARRIYDTVLSMPLPVNVKADVLNNTRLHSQAYGHFGATSLDGRDLYIGDKTYRSSAQRWYQVVAHETSHVITFRIMSPPVRAQLESLMPASRHARYETLADCMASVYGASGRMDYLYCPSHTQSQVRDVLRANGLL